MVNFGTRINLRFTIENVEFDFCLVGILFEILKVSYSKEFIKERKIYVEYIGEELLYVLFVYYFNFFILYFIIFLRLEYSEFVRILFVKDISVCQVMDDFVSLFCLFIQ